MILKFEDSVTTKPQRKKIVDVLLTGVETKWKN